MRGMLISFEGIDGSGKTTQAERLTRHIGAIGRNVLLLREPGGTSIGERIRGILLDPSCGEMVPLAELFLYLAARAQIVDERIRPALGEGTVVILDRYIDSTAAYQGVARGLGLERIVELNRIATSGLIPDVTVLVDCDPVVALGRLSRSHDRLESEGLPFLSRVREGFLNAAAGDPGRFIVVDGAGDIDAVEREVFNRLGERAPELAAGAGAS